MSWAQILVALGVGGFALYAVTFALVQVGRLDGNGLTFTVCNMVAATLVLISMLEQFNLGSLLTQVTWIVVGVVGILRRRSQSSASPSLASRSSASQSNASQSNAPTTPSTEFTTSS